VPLTEACFQATPVPFARRTALEWANGTRLEIAGSYLTSDGNLPIGSTWAMNPLPYSDAHGSPQFAPPCDEDPARRLYNDTGECSGRFPWAVSVVDWLVVPEGLPAGDYVLGFRWDCEATAQIWQSCADIEIAN
jgi:lytic starch monooxygenase